MHVRQKALSNDIRGGWDTPDDAVIAPGMRLRGATMNTRSPFLDESDDLAFACLPLATCTVDRSRSDYLWLLHMRGNWRRSSVSALSRADHGSCGL